MEVPVEKVYALIQNKHVVADRQQAVKLVVQQIGRGLLETPGKMRYNEFNKLFCKGMFKVALINMINNLTKGDKNDGRQGALCEKRLRELEVKLEHVEKHPIECEQR